MALDVIVEMTSGTVSGGAMGSNGTFEPPASDVARGDVDRYVVSFRPSSSALEGQARIDKNITRNTRTDTDVFHDIVQ